MAITAAPNDGRPWVAAAPVPADTVLEAVWDALPPLAAPALPALRVAVAAVRAELPLPEALVTMVWEQEHEEL